MFNEQDLYHVAANTKSELAQTELLALGKKIQEVLAVNESLHQGPWDTLYEQLTATRSSYLYHLLANAPTQEALYRVLPALDEDTLELAIELGMDISPKLAGMILTRAEAPDTDGLIYHLLCSGAAPKDQLGALYQRIVQAYSLPSSDSAIILSSLVALATKYDHLTDEQVVGLLQPFNNNLSYALAHVIDHRPSIITTLLESTKRASFTPGVSSSRHLTAVTAREIYQELLNLGVKDELAFQTLKGLADNPNTPYDVRARSARYLLSELTQYVPQELAAPLQVAAEEYQRCFEAGFLPVTSSWESADKYDLPRVRYAVKHLPRQFYPTLAPYTNAIPELQWGPREDPNKRVIQDYLDPYLDELGPNGWAVFLNLLLNWCSSLDTLLQVVTQLTKA